MVFESVLADVLNKYLRPYVKRLDSSQLNIGVWKGHVRVEKLELKENIFEEVLAESNIDIPLRIKRSYIGTMDMQIPWKSLTKEPIIVTIDEVYIILGPDLDTKYDADREKERLRKEKAKKMKEFNDVMKKKIKAKEAKKKKKKQKDSEKPDTFAEKLAVHMTKNLQVVVRDIHIRYEDDITNPNSLVAAGITLHSLNLKSTDGNWVPCVVRETATVIYKLLELNCLSLYWNTSCVTSFASPDLSMQQMIDKMRSVIARPALPPPPTNSYLLNPMSASAKLKLNLKPGVDLTLPQLLMGVECEDIVFTLKQIQLKTLLVTVESYDRHVVNQKYLRYKPSGLVVKEDPRAWWVYAITAVLEEDVKRRTQMWSWKHIKQHRQTVKLYVEKYREKLRSINPSSSLLDQIQKLEDDLDWFNILVYRKQASKKEKSKSKKDIYPLTAKVSATSQSPTGSVSQSDVKVATTSKSETMVTPEATPTSAANRKSVALAQKGSKTKKTKEKKEDGFFSKLKLKMKHSKKDADSSKERSVSSIESQFVLVGNSEAEGASGPASGSAGTTVGDSKTVKESKTSPLQVPNEEEEEINKEELYRAIGYSPDEGLVEYPREYVAHEVHVLITTVTVELVGRKQKLGTLVTKHIQAGVFNRPGSESVSVQASVSSLEMSGVSKGDRTITMVTSNVGDSLASDTPLVDFRLEVNPLDKPSMDVSVTAVLRPLQIIYDFDTVNGLVEMFKPPNLIRFQELTNAASASWDQLKSQTTASLKDAVQDRKQIDIDITLHSPHLLIPESGDFSKDSCLIVVDLGQLRVFGSTKDPSTFPKEAPSKDDFMAFYDKFSVTLERLQVLAAKPGEDWKRAMLNATSPLHIIDPTGLEIQLLKSIVTDDALLPSMRIEGTLLGFRVKLSDSVLTSLIKVASTLKKPPAMITTTDEYNELPSRPPPKMILDDVSKLADFDTLSLSSVSSYGDDDDESLADEAETCPLSPILDDLTPENKMTDEDISRNVFTDVSINLVVNEVSVHLTQTCPSQKKSSPDSQQSLLDIVIRGIQANVVDRKWDTQGSVAIRDVMVIDYITKDLSGKPSYLLKTECLDDGNFIFARFVTITKVGVDFAAKYTHLEDSLSAQLSLVKLKLHRSTIKGLIEYAGALVPSIPGPSKPQESADYMTSGGLEAISEHGPSTTTNPKDFDTTNTPKSNDFKFNVEFDGVDLTLAQDDSDFLQSSLTGFSIRGTAEPKVITVVASIKDLTVKDVCLGSSGAQIISKADSDRSFVLLNVVQYNFDSRHRDPHNLDWVDTSLKAEVNRVNVNLDTNFLTNVLEFVKKLEIDQSVFESAAKATAETATVTATAIIENAKTAHRLKLDLTLHAPVIELPFFLPDREGSIYVDLGEFQISNSLKHGLTIHHGSVSSSDTSVETVNLFGAQTILDSMQIKSSSIQIYRISRATKSECSLTEAYCLKDVDESRSTILEPLQFTASVIRNISEPTRAFPNVDVHLVMNVIKLHLHEEDVQALITIGLAASRITEVMSAPPKEDIPVRPRVTTTFAKPKAPAVPISRQRSRTRAGSRLKRFHSYEEVTDVRIEVTLESVTFDLTTNNGPLLNAGASGLVTKVDVLEKKVLVSASVRSLNVVDLTSKEGSSKVVSIADKTDALTSVLITIYTEEGINPLSPLGKIQANIAQLQLFVPVPFVFQAVEFAMRLNIDKGMLATATKTAQDGASAVSTAAQDKYFIVELKAHAPVLLIPTDEHSTQAVMIDLGSLLIQNQLIIPDMSAENIGIDAYGITLNSFKISRVLLDPTVEVGSPVTAERTLLQPFNLLLAVERNLCSWHTAIPAVSINLNMERLKIFLGEEDLEQLFGFGMSVGDQVSHLLQKDQTTPAASVAMVTESDKESSKDLATLSKETSEAETQVADSDVEAYEFIRVIATLDGFEVKLFQNEPKLIPINKSSKAPSELNDWALARLQLVTMKANVKVSSNNEVQVEASLQDIALTDERKESRDRRTGNRVIQHYTSNPLHAYTGKIDKPLLNMKYILRTDEHIIFFNAEKLLILSDIDFMKAMANYFKAIFMPPSDQTKQVSSQQAETGVVEVVPKTEDKQSSSQVAKPDKKKSTPLPKLKANISIKDFRVAIIENVDAAQPQALSLKVSTHIHAQLSEVSKKVSVSVVDLGIATSNFFDLDVITSWVLLPCSMTLSMDGPIDTPEMNVHVTVEPISLTLSPAIVRLIIQAVQTLVPEQEENVVSAPTDLWDKKLISDSNLWFLLPVPLHKALTDVDPEKKGEMLILSVQSVEVYLESESVEDTRGHPVLALNVSADFRMSEWTGQLTMSGDVFVEASYFNTSLSVWEPLLEPLEFLDGSQRLWEMNVTMEKIPSNSLNSTDEKPNFSLGLSAIYPLQLTLTRTSLQLFKTLVEAYTKDYGKQVQGIGNLQALTGAPFVFVNKLGKDTVLFLQPGNFLRLKDRAKFSKLKHGESVDMFLEKDVKKRSYASTIAKEKGGAPTVDIAVGNKFRHIKSIPVDLPGQFYYTLLPKEEVEGSLSTYGLVVEIAVTGEKKTIIARSPVQFINQLMISVDLLEVGDGSSSSPSLVKAIQPGQTFPAPLHMARSGQFLIRPSDFGFEPEGPVISWNSKHEVADTQTCQCHIPGIDSSFHFIRVNRHEETYIIRRNLPKEEFPHHIFRFHPPMVVHNLLPFNMFVESVGSGNPAQCIEPGKCEHIFDLDLEKNPEICILVLQKQKPTLKGKFILTKKPPPYINFHISEESSSVELSVHTENDSYLKLGVFCPFWMVNKTDLTLQYKDGNTITKHKPQDSIVLLSTNNNKNKIQLGAITKNNSDTEWTKSFSLNAVGTSGNFSAKLGENVYKFGVEIRLSQFTLTKLVIITPYYLLVNETKTNFQAYVEVTPANRTLVPPEEVVPFWPLSSDKNMMVIGGSAEDGEPSAAFNYHQSDSTVLQFSESSEVSALCVEVQESETATMITFTPYYPGCVPVQIINHFPDVSIQFSQETKSSLAIIHTLQPREVMQYTWDNPSGKKVIRWTFPGAKVSNCKLIDVNKDNQHVFSLKFPTPTTPGDGGGLTSSLFKKGSNSKLSSGAASPVNKAVGDTWLEIDETLSEQLVSMKEYEDESGSLTTDSMALSQGGASIGPDSESVHSLSSSTSTNSSGNRGYWKSFIDGLQRVVIFTPDEGVLERIRAENSYSVPLFEASLSLRSVGLSLVDNDKKRELAYIAIIQSGIIWQIDKGKRIWKTVNTSLIEILEEAYQEKRKEIKIKSLNVNLETMEMYSPIVGKLRRTNHDGVFVKFALSEKDYSLHAKIGYVQVDNQLPFSVYPQVLYPIPPPPTVASSIEPKPFVEASLILRKNEQSNGYHFKYVHVLIQKMAVNVDLGFILSLVDFFSLSGSDPLFQVEYVENDIEYVAKSLKETVVPELADDFSISRSFFDVLHFAPIKVTLSFNIRSVGKNKAENEITVGDRFLELFLHSIGVILTSVQETEMKFSCFHLEYQPQTGRGLMNLLIKHYRNQALFQLHTLIFGLDVLGNPVSVVRGVVEGAIDLFYEPIKGSVLGPEEFFEGLGLGLRSFFGAGVVGGITGAGARITGAVGDVFAKLTFDGDFVDKRQQQKTKPPKMGRKLGSFAKNLFEGVTGVVTQPVKGLQKEGAVGLLKGTGRGIIGLLVRPTGGLVDLASGTLDFVTRKTQIGSFEISDVRPPRFVGRDGVILPFSPLKAIGTALLVGVDEGKFVETDYYFNHIEVSPKPLKFVLITDRRFMLIEKRVLADGWKLINQAIFEFMSKPVQNKDINVIVSYKPKYKDKRLEVLNLLSETLADKVALAINESYVAFLSEQ